MERRWALVALLAPLLTLSSSLPAAASTAVPTATEVIGSGSGPASSVICPPSQMIICDPFAIAFDSRGNLWLADGQDNRVLEFPLTGGSIAAMASVVIGQANFTSSICGAGQWPIGMRSSTLCFPDGLAFDAAGNLWVADGGGDRVVEYPLLNGAISNQVALVIGPNFTSAAPGLPSEGLLLPVGISFDHAGDLWVADLSHSRVLEFASVDGAIAGVPSRVIGQGNMSGGFCNQTITIVGQINATASDLCFPSSLAFDSRGDLWVADFGLNEFVPGNSRLLMFPSVSGVVSSTATEVIGQPDFSGYGCNGGYNLSTEASLCLPVSLAFDSLGNLWVADSGNSRVLEFPFLRGAVSASAGALIGQTSYNNHTCNENLTSLSDTSLCRPLAIAFDSHGDLWVSDTNNYRILEFAGIAPNPGQADLWLLIVGIVAAFAVLIGADFALNRQPDPTSSMVDTPQA